MTLGKSLNLSGSHEDIKTPLLTWGAVRLILSMFASCSDTKVASSVESPIDKCRDAQSTRSGLSPLGHK